MIGVVVVAHFGIAKEIIDAATRIMDREIAGLTGVSIDYTEDSESISNKLKQALKEVDKGDGVLIFTDMFGGTPSNVGLTFHEKDKVEVISGLNLPMLLKAVSQREGKGLSELANATRSAGRESIQMASDLLSGR